MNIQDWRILHRTRYLAQSTSKRQPCIRQWDHLNIFDTCILYHNPGYLFDVVHRRNFTCIRVQPGWGGPRPIAGHGRDRRIAPGHPPDDRRAPPRVAPSAAHSRRSWRGSSGAGPSYQPLARVVPAHAFNINNNNVFCVPLMPSLIRWYSCAFAVTGGACLSHGATSLADVPRSQHCLVAR